MHSNHLPLGLIPHVLKIPWFGEFNSMFWNNTFVLTLKITDLLQYQCCLSYFIHGHVSKTEHLTKNKIAWVWGSYNASVVTVQSGSGKIYLAAGAAGIWTKTMALGDLKP